MQEQRDSYSFGLEYHVAETERSRFPLRLIESTMSRAETITRLVICLLICVGCSWWAISVKLAGQPMPVWNRYGSYRTLLSADRAAVSMGISGALALVMTLVYARELQKGLRSRRRGQRAAARLCVYCGYPRGTLSFSDKCPECGKECP